MNGIKGDEFPADENTSIMTPDLWSRISPSRKIIATAKRPVLEITNLIENIFKSGFSRQSEK